MVARRRGANETDNRIDILHKGARYIEYGTAVNPKAAQLAIRHHLKALRRLGYPSSSSP